MVSVKAICLPEIKDLTYSLELTITTYMEISTGFCSYPTGRGPHGSCKHLETLFFATEDFVKVRTIALERLFNCKY